MSTVKNTIQTKLNLIEALLLKPGQKTFHPKWPHLSCIIQPNSSIPSFAFCITLCISYWMPLLRDDLTLHYSRELLGCFAWSAALMLSPSSLSTASWSKHTSTLQDARISFLLGGYLESILLKAQSRYFICQTLQAKKCGFYFELANKQVWVKASGSSLTRIFSLLVNFGAFVSLQDGGLYCFSVTCQSEYFKGEKKRKEMTDYNCFNVYDDRN